MDEKSGSTADLERLVERFTTDTLSWLSAALSWQIPTRQALRRSGEKEFADRLPEVQRLIRGALRDGLPEHGLQELRSGLANAWAQRVWASAGIRSRTKHTSDEAAETRDLTRRAKVIREAAQVLREPGRLAEGNDRDAAYWAGLLERTDLAEELDRIGSTYEHLSDFARSVKHGLVVPRDRARQPSPLTILASHIKDATQRWATKARRDTFLHDLCTALLAEEISDSVDLEQRVKRYRARGRRRSSRSRRHNGSH